jgi:adenylate cyclase
MRALAMVVRYRGSEDLTMTERIIPATARRPAGVTSPSDVLNPQRVLLSPRSLFAPEAAEGDQHGDRPTIAATGTAPPDPHDQVGEPIAVERTFAFVDITGFTEYCDEHGEQSAVALLTRFRTIVRDVTARRGVRVAKWLGDGAMLVGIEEGAVVASTAEVVVRCTASGLATHAGLASGTVLLFEGDDYVGRPANLASRLCDGAEAGEILAAGLAHRLPEWIERKASVTVRVEGVGEHSGIMSLGIRDQVLRQLSGEVAGEHTAA